MLSIVSITLLILALAVTPCSNATISVFSKFGALRENFYDETIKHEILKQFRKGKNTVREFLRGEERGRLF